MIDVQLVSYLDLFLMILYSIQFISFIFDDIQVNLPLWLVCFHNVKYFIEVFEHFLN